MGRKMKNITNQTFGRLTVLGFDHFNKSMSYWKCKCSCGNERIVARSNLISGATKSRGCLNNEKRKSKKPQYRKYLKED